MIDPADSGKHIVRKGQTMNTIIDADAAKLAGLQIDLLQKVRQGHVTLSHLEWFTGLSRDAREALMESVKPASQSTPSPEPTEKFALLVDLGVITVPDDYDHANHLKTFAKQNDKKFCYYNNDINDENFSNPTRILKPGDKLCVRAFKQIVGGSTTSEERVAFLTTQKAIHTGAQGDSLVFDQKRSQLLKGTWYVSFDEEDCLWTDTDDYHRVPYVNAFSDGDFSFDLGDFESVWDVSIAFLCFCDVE